MRIYTKMGDQGMTGLIGGKRVSKNAVRVEAYGTLDELNSLIGLIISMGQMKDEILQELKNIQQVIFDCGSDLANPDEVTPFKVKQESVSELEKRIDFYTEAAPSLKTFILPGGCQEAAWLHMARVVTRRAEREVVNVQSRETIHDIALQYINRLSDYFFALARFVNFCAGEEEVICR